MKILAAVLALSCLSVVRLPAQTLNWSTPVKYGTGYLSTVAMNTSGLVVEVHTSQNLPTMHYHIGKLDRSTGRITWGRSRQISTKTQPDWPSVAITENSNVILVFDDEHVDLHYMTGTLDPTGSADQSINWVVPDTTYDTGRTPRISIDAAGRLVEVHQNDDSRKRLFYRSGYVDPTTSTPNIVWTSGPQGIPYEWGQYPHIALNDHSSLVEVHRESSGNNLHYRRGGAFDNNVIFGPSHFLPSTGNTASIALTNSDLAITVLDNSGVIYATAGYLHASDHARIDWGPFAELASPAGYPAVATDGDWIVAVWTKGFGGNFEMQYSVARVP
jgi:hypothetical protein